MKRIAIPLLIALSIGAAVAFMAFERGTDPTGPGGPGDARDPDRPSADRRDDGGGRDARDPDSAGGGFRTDADDDRTGGDPDGTGAGTDDAPDARRITRADVAEAFGAVAGEGVDSRELSAMLVRLSQGGPGTADLVRPYLEDPTRPDDVRALAVRLLGLLGDGSSMPLFERELRTWREGDGVRVRVAVAEALGRVGGDRAADLLTGLLGRDEDLGVRLAAVEGLGRLSDPRTAGTLVEVLREDRSDMVRSRAGRALAAMGERAPVDVLVGMVLDRDEQVGRHAAETLGRIAEARGGDLGGRDVLRPLLEAAGPGGDAGVRAHALRAIGHTGSDQALPLLRAALDNPDPQVAASAAKGLGHMDTPAAWLALVNAVGDDVRPEAVRAAAAGALGSTSLPRTAPALLDELAARAPGDPSPRVRATLALSLGDTDSDVMETPLMTMLAEDPVPNVRWSAAFALGRLKSERAVPVLVDVLESDDDETVRVQAALALGKIATPAAIQALESAVRNDESDRVREKATTYIDAYYRSQGRR